MIHVDGDTVMVDIDLITMSWMGISRHDSLIYLMLNVFQMMGMEPGNWIDVVDAEKHHEGVSLYYHHH